MESKGKPVGFMSAMRDFFGLKPEQKLQEFAAEVREATATPEDKAYFVKGLQQNGYVLENV